MQKKIVSGVALSKGVGDGYLLISKEPISFFGGVDPSSGVIIDKWHPLYGKNIRKIVLALPRSKGSTVGSYIIYALSKNGVAPSAMILMDRDILIASGCIIGKIPLVKLDKEKWILLSNYHHAIVNGDEGFVEME